MKRSPKRESWLPRGRASGPDWPRFAVASLVLVCAIRLATPASAITLGRPSSEKPVAAELEELHARALVLVIPGVSWSQLRAADLPNIQRLLDNGASTLMPAGQAPMPSAPGASGRLRLAYVLARGDQAAARRDLRRALNQSQMVVVDFGGGSQPRDLLASADLLVGDALADLRGREGLIALVCPSDAKPFGGALYLGSAILWEIGGRDDLPVDQLRFDPEFYAKEPSRYFHWMLTLNCPGVLNSASTRWTGLVSPADLSPTLMAWWGAASGSDAPATGRMLSVELERDSKRLSRLDRLDSMLTDRYRLRVPMAKLYGVYGLLAALAGVALAVWRRRTRFLGAAALGVAFVPVGLAIAAPIPPGHDALYLGVSLAIAVAFGLLGSASARRGPTFGLALAMLLGAGLIAADVLNGSPLMRLSALEMGIMMGSRFYGIGNEYMGALVGMTVIGLGAMVQVAPSRGRLAAMIGAFVALVIGLACWGANWGGSFTAAVGLLALWLLSVPRVKARHVAAALALLAGSVVVPAALDLLNAPPNRSHIGASAAALLSGSTAGLGDTITRKAAIVLKVIRVAPWSGLAALIAAGVFWLQLRRGAPARRALEGHCFLTAGIAAALIAGVVAMLINDSGPAAGMGAILAALGAVVFLASRAPEVVA